VNGELAIRKEIEIIIMKKLIIAFVLTILIFTMGGTAESMTEEYLPKSVKIKTPTQTFNKYYYFALKDGCIFFKPNAETTGKRSGWKPFLENGLPHNSDIENYPIPNSITEIHADADEIVALSDTGRFYWLRIETGASWNAMVWSHLWGWPESEPLFLKGRAALPRAWAIGRRNKDVLYHEDIDGNPHHFGTMGITTLYVLTSDGREIVYTDSGLPADFSHTIILPHRGKFIAESMSVSASTIFIIDASGKMYTRLVDFDTIGSDPMFFKYSYRREKRKDKGKDWASNFTVWSLPAEDWHEQPLIELNGQAELSSMITIYQNGHGNAARELRVAGKNSEGKTGYFFKMIFDEKWNFREYPGVLEESRMLSLIHRKNENLTNGDIYYSGKIRENDKYVPNTLAELIDFNLSESPSILRITQNGSISEMMLHTVEAWTHVIRNDPGRDGTPKIFLGTLEMPDEDKDYESIAETLKSHNMETFGYIVEATKEHVYIRPRSGLYGNIEFILTAEGASVRSSMAARTFAMAQNGFDNIASSEELKINSLDTLTQADIPLLKKKVEMNLTAKKQINAIIADIKKSSKRISKTSALFTAFSTIVHATGLVLLDKPKIWTATRHFGTVLNGYKESYEFLYFTGKQSHEDAIKKIDLRMYAYTDKINELEGMSSQGVFFSEHFSDYFKRLRISDSEVDFFLSKDIRAACDVSPVKDGHSFFLIHLWQKEDDTKLLTLLVKLPRLEEELSRQLSKEDTIYGKYKAMIYLFEDNGSEDAENLYEDIFTKHFSTRHNADEIKASLMIDKDGWQLYDTSGFQKNQIWIKHTN
jgi:hypothetical protein